MNDIQAEILSELRTIRWMLFLVVLWLGAFVYFAVKAAERFKLGAGNLKENLEHNKFQRQTEGLLQRGSYDMAVADSRKRLESHPSDVYAHFYLARALFHTQKLHEARRAFQQVAELEPTWQRSVDAWLERVDEKVKDAGPKLVN